MRWQECFNKYNYNALILEDESGERRTDIENFCVSDQIPDELRQIYVGKCGDEMFLILRVNNVKDMEKFRSTWDNRIMVFINFSKWRDEIEIKKLQYNITQILLFEGYVDKQLEKSVSVSRKIFVKCNVSDELDEDNKVLLPFWLEDLEGEKINIAEEQKLYDLLPADESLAFMCKKREKLDRRQLKKGENTYNFRENEWMAMEGWLKENAVERN